MEEGAVAEERERKRERGKPEGESEERGGGGTHNGEEDQQRIQGAPTGAPAACVPAQTMSSCRRGGPVAVRLAFSPSLFLVGRGTNDLTAF